MNKLLLFVYGTLKSGHVRQAIMRDQRYIGVARTESKYGMFQYSNYPALIEDNGNVGELPCNKAILGELYEVDDACMLELDKIEGLSSGLFDRRAVALTDITVAKLPTEETAWNSLANKKADTYFFKDAKKLNGARNCGSMWTVR